MPNKPSYDIESEQALLAALMLERNIYKQIDLSIDDFYETKHQKIYKIIIELSEEGMEADYVTVNAKIKAHGWGQEIESVYVCGLASDIPSAVTKNWKNYVSIIKKKSAARKLLMLARHMEKVSQNGLNDLDGKLDDVMRQLIEIKGKAANKSTSIQDKVKAWIDVTSGNFFVTDCNKDLGAVTASNKSAIRMAVKRLADANYIVPCGNKNGCYRILERDAPLIDFLNVNLSEPYPIKWPFGIDAYVDLYPGNVVVVAGAANAGKTALLLNVVRMNMHKLKVEYFSSEMGPEELHLRLRKFEGITLKEWNFAARKRSIKFADVIVPDALNIIDYLEVTKDFYEIGGDIKDIFDRLNKGIAIIALQKKTGTDFGRGGEFTLEKPRLYLSMENGAIKIVKGKNWSNPEINPNNMTWKFKLVNGCKFLVTGGSPYDLT
jgi:hypothetical protein